MTPSAWIAIIAICITIIIALVTALVNFAHKQGTAEGQVDSRIVSLETWRDRVRGDMHEISEKLEMISAKVGRVETLIEERTDRRKTPRIELSEEITK